MPLNIQNHAIFRSIISLIPFILRHANLTDTSSEWTMFYHAHFELYFVNSLISARYLFSFFKSQIYQFQCLMHCCNDSGPLLLSLLSPAAIPFFWEPFSSATSHRPSFFSCIHCLFSFSLAEGNKIGGFRISTVRLNYACSECLLVRLQANLENRREWWFREKSFIQHLSRISRGLQCFIRMQLSKMLFADILSMGSSNYIGYP